MKFVASRLSDNNKIFPAEIHIEDNGLTVKLPGFFNGKSEHFIFSKISNVSVTTPLIGFSTITFKAAGTKLSAHGFTKSEVNQIRKEIDKRIRNEKNPKEVIIKKIVEKREKPQGIDVNREYPNSDLQEKIIESRLESEKLEREKLRIELQERENKLKEKAEEEKLQRQKELYKNLEWKREFDQKIYNQSLESKKLLVEKYKYFGHFLVFWRYTLNKIWKKILFCYIVLTIIAVIYEFILESFQI